MSYKTVIIRVGAIAIVGLAVWTTFISYHATPIARPTRATVQLPDAIMTDVHAIVMGKDGNPSLKISTPQMIHFSDNDTSHMITPIVILYRNTPQPWHITAQTAMTTQGINNVIFYGNVVLHHIADSINPDTLIKTTTLTVHPNQKIAQTAAPVTLIQPGTAIDGIGMFANIDTGYVKILSQVRGRYVPGSS